MIVQETTEKINDAQESESNEFSARVGTSQFLGLKSEGGPGLAPTKVRVC